MTSATDLIGDLRPHLTIDINRWPDKHNDYHADCPYCNKPAKKGQTHFRITPLSPHACFYCQVCGKNGSIYKLAIDLGASIALSNNSTPDTEYDYVDANGNLLYQSVRYYDNTTGKKSFYQRRPDGNGGWVTKKALDGVPRVLYRLPDVTAAIHAGETIYVVEGEKDVESLRLHDLTATTNCCGAGKWLDEYSDALVGANVVILPDNDDAGKKHAQQVAKSLVGKAASTKIVDLPGLLASGDVTDWLCAGHTIDDLIAVVNAPTNPTTKMMKDLLAQQFEPIKWAIPDILPEGCIILAAKPKMGKSMLALDWCIAIATGGKAMDKVDVEAGDVLYLSLEDGERRLQARTQAMNVNVYNCPDTFEYQDEWPTLDNGGLDLIEQWIIAHPNRRLIVIDTLVRVRSKMMRGQQLYDHDYESVKALKELADRYHVTILVIYHTRKADAGDFIDTLNATTGLAGSVDAILVIKRERGQADAELHMTGKDVDEIARPLRFNYPHWELLDGTAEEYRMSNERADVIEQLMLNLPRSSTPKEIAEALGKKTGTINKMMLAMLRDGQIRQSGIYGKYMPLQDYKVDTTTTTATAADDESEPAPTPPVQAPAAAVPTHEPDNEYEDHAPDDDWDIDENYERDAPTSDAQITFDDAGLIGRLHARNRREALVTEWERLYGRELIETLTYEQLEAAVAELRNGHEANDDPGLP